MLFVKLYRNPEYSVNLQYSNNKNGGSHSCEKQNWENADTAVVNKDVTRDMAPCIKRLLANYRFETSSKQEKITISKQPANKTINHN